MKILINTSSTYDGGAIQVALSFIQECRKIKGNEYHVLLGMKIAEYIIEKDYPRSFHFYYVKFRPAKRVVSLKPLSSYFRSLEELINPEVVFTTSGPAYWSPKAPHLCGFNIPQNLYRESRYFKQLTIKKQLKWKVDKFVRRYFFKKEANHFVVQTDDINSRLRLWFRSENVYTVSNTCHDYYFNRVVKSSVLPQKKSNEFRFLTLSTFRGHKNFSLIKAIIDNLEPEFLSRVYFVITIPQKEYVSFFDGRYRDNVINVGPIKVHDAPGLYMECDAAFLPSVLECFSAAYPEAMAMKLPIMASDLTFARSICQNAAFYFDPYDGKVAAKMLTNFVDDIPLQKDLVKNGQIRLRYFGDGLQRASNYLELCEFLIQNKL